MRPVGNRLWAAGLATALALTIAVVPTADAKDKHKSKKRYRDRYSVERVDREVRWRHAYRTRPVRYVVVRRPRRVIVRPAYVEHFVVQRPRFIVVRPVPYWPVDYGDGVSARVGIRTGGLNLAFDFRRHDPYYGCNFCDSYYTSYSSWERHVTHCSHHGSGRVIAEPWGPGDVDRFRDGACDAWDDYRGRDDDRYDEDWYDN